MGIQDRDYYKKWWNERNRYVERAKFRIPSNEDPQYFPKQFRSPPIGNDAQDDGGDYLRSARKPQSRPWHPILTFLLTGFICMGIYGLLKLISKFA